MEHEAAAGLSCFLCLYGIFGFSWWICGNVWCADLPQRRCFCSDPAILCPTVPRRASAPSCLSIASVFVARRIPRSEVLRVVLGSRAGPGGPPDRRICDAMRRYGHEKHLKAAEPASRICDAPTHRLGPQTLLEPATQRAKQLATLVASEQGASTLQLLGSVLSMSTVTGALAGSPGSATGGLVRGPGSATGGLQMRSEAAFGGDSLARWKGCVVVILRAPVVGGGGLRGVLPRCLLTCLQIIIVMVSSSSSSSSSSLVLPISIVLHCRRVLGPGYVPDACKNGSMGDNTLWKFSQVRMCMCVLARACVYVFSQAHTSGWRWRNH